MKLQAKIISRVMEFEHKLVERFLLQTHAELQRVRGDISALMFEFSSSENLARYSDLLNRRKELTRDMGNIIVKLELLERKINKSK